ncbi:MAG TPA: phosphoribosyltransferase family protein [Flavitalea sp.]|nr:phosphoribosyltransferase family protein [Flavitalea sp.]
MSRKYILDENTVAKKLERMALEIIENNLEEQELILIGIRDHGSVIAKAIEGYLQKLSSIRTKLIHFSLDKKHPGKVEISEEIDFTGKAIIIVDDVTNSGKTMLYALQPLLPFYPKEIQTLALVERSHKAFPVHTDYVGISLATTLQDHIYVEVDGDRVTGAYII